MVITEGRNTDRVLFFDHIRYLMVLLVVVLHAACGYSNYMPHWAVNDFNLKFFDILVAILDIFLMPVLFFIAGYFALPSLEAKGVIKFIKTKLIRLGIPLIFGLLLFNPIEHIVFYYSRSYSSFSLWDRFVFNLKNAFSPQTGKIISKLEFSHSYFWFISLLLFFFIVFACCYWLKSRIFNGQSVFEQEKVTPGKSILWVLSGAALATTILTFFIVAFFYDGVITRSWLIIENVLQFQPIRISLYVFCFGTGIYAYGKKWFNQTSIPGNYIFWVVFSLILLELFRVIETKMISTGIALADVFIILFVRHFLVFSILLTLISLSKRFWNKTSAINRLFAKNSYNTYLFHMVFVILLQLALFKWINGFIFLKFAIVSVGSIGLSVLVSNYLIRPFPKLSAIGIAGIFFLGTIFI
ncbi:MAG: acyltransferase family protein [Desulfobacteraceae bacterium]|nr:acyltransferase family protein [Desulfobacteraceae bacterium]